MLRAGDQVWDTSTTTGTGDITVSGTAPTGYRTLSAMFNIVVGDTFFYSIRHRSAAEWETGLGTYSASNTLTRTTVFESSNSNAAVSFSAGTKDVICSFIAGAFRYISVEPPQGRITLTSATPVLTSTVSAAATVYYTPYTGRIVPLYDGTDFTNVNFAELSNVLANSSTGKAGPAAGAAASVYDLFVWDDAGTLRLTRGPAWTSDTARAAGGGLTVTNGIALNTSAITNGPAASRGTWVGTIMTDAGGATVSWTFGANAAGGTAGWFGLWNAYSRRQVSSTTGDTGDSWTYATTTWRSANASATMRCTFVRGANEDTVLAEYLGCAKSSATTVFGQTGVALDATNTFSGPNATIASTGAVPAPSHYKGLPGLGKHFLQATEFASAATITFFGDSGLTGVQTGLMTTLWA